VALTKRLQKTWAQLSGPLLSSIESDCQEGAWQDAKDKVARLSLTQVGIQNKEYIQFTLQAVATFGAAQAGGGKAVFLPSLKNTSPVANATAQLQLYLQLAGTEQMQEEVLHSIAMFQQEHQKLGSELTESPLKPFVSFAGAGNDQIELISSLQSNRIASWGFFGEADLLGLQTYKLVAILDGRTSEFCRYVANGKIFQVAQGKRLIEQSLATQDPDDLKSLQPWPNQSAASIKHFRTLDSTELAALGYMVPPFHPGCRTLCVRVNYGTPIKIPVPAQVPFTSQVSSMASFSELGQTVTQQQLNQWNAAMGVSPVEVLSRLTGTNPQELLEGGIKKLFHFDAQGDITSSINGLYKDSKYSTEVTLDPFTKKLYLDKADLVAGDTGAEKEFLKNLLSSVIDLGGSINGSSVVLAAGLGEAGSYIKLGFLPTPLDWQNIRQDALDSEEYKAFAAQLRPDQQALLSQALQNNDETAANVIANLPWTVDGKTAADVVLGGYSGNLSLDLSDPTAVQTAQSYLR